MAISLFEFRLSWRIVCRADVYNIAGTNADVYGNHDKDFRASASVSYKGFDQYSG